MQANQNKHQISINEVLVNIQKRSLLTSIWTNMLAFVSVAQKLEQVALVSSS